MTTNEQLNKSLDKKMDTISIHNGYWFYFEVDGLEIAAHGSAYSGRETIYINDNPVSDKRNLFSTKGSHSFHYQGKGYKVVFNMTSILRGELVCQLYIDNDLHAEQTKAYIESASKCVIDLLKVFGLFLVAGFFVGSLIGFLVNYFAG
ncbi:hypothetical protein [Shewanella goraebulensis]|uniref:hypothetical protein n=1 Tax=Shewanella goraebulensis TaxID=3050637 RepID=UPI00254FC098|nr:hypothetical protein [Shewanella goraebulensis]